MQTKLCPGTQVAPAEGSGTVLILGATSAIAREVATVLVQQGFALFLAGRDTDEIERMAHDLQVRHLGRVDYGRFDARDIQSHPAFFQQVLDSSPGGLAGVVLAFGLLGDHGRAVQDFSHAEEIIAANFSGAASILTHAARHLEQRRSGFIVGLSSVAGDRGRQSNYVYGAAKGAFSLFQQGLRNRLARSGVQVITVKLGFVDTAMTYGKPGLFLVADPASVARGIIRAVERKRDVVYLPGFWRYIMLTIRLIPESIFKRMSL